MISSIWNLKTNIDTSANGALSQKYDNYDTVGTKALITNPITDRLYYVQDENAYYVYENNNLIKSIPSTTEINSILLSDSVQDTRLNALEYDVVKKTYVDNNYANVQLQISNIDSINTTQNSRLNTLDNATAFLQTNITSINSLDNAQNTRLTLLETDQVTKTYVDTQDVAINNNVIALTNEIYGGSVIIGPSTQSILSKITNLQNSTNNLVIMSSTLNNNIVALDNFRIVDEANITTNTTNITALQNNYINTINGTTNQIVSNKFGNAVDLSLPQDINLTSNMTLNTLTLNGAVTNATNATTKSYVDNVDTNLQTQINTNSTNITTNSTNITTLQTNYINTINGTTNQIISNKVGNVVTLSLPQNIDSGANPTFAKVTISGTINGANAATNKTYVDNADAGLQTQINTNTTNITNLTNTKMNAIIAGAGITLTGTMPNLTISATGGASNNQSVNFTSGLYLYNTGMSSVVPVPTVTSTSNTYSLIADNKIIVYYNMRIVCPVLTGTNLTNWACIKLPLQVDRLTTGFLPTDPKYFRCTYSCAGGCWGVAKLFRYLRFDSTTVNGWNPDLLPIYYDYDASTGNHINCLGSDVSGKTFELFASVTYNVKLPLTLA